MKKKIIYRSTYRGTKEMDVLLSSFTKQIINDLNEDELINLVKHYKEKYNDEKNVPRPDHWSGWILLPKEIEFWLHTDNRIHERLKYSKDNNGNWNKFLLNP